MSYLEKGGNYEYAVKRLSQWVGAVNESDVPYADAQAVYNNGLDNKYAYDYDVAHLQNAYRINVKEQPDVVKQQIMEHGAVGASYTHYYAGENHLNNSYYDMQGIVNGIDYQVYNPATDNKIYCNYDAESFRKKKVNNKLKLQEDLGLTVDKKKYMIGLISRLTDQKGLDLINFVIDRIVDDFTQLVVIGTGEGQYENMFRYYAWKYPDRVSANICYSDDLAHKLYASADAFLMPSRFEPCGLTQLISFRYGTVPIVRETGGLKDTVVPYNEYENTGDGFSFSNYNGEEMLSVINYSKHIFFDKKKQWNQIIDRGMAKDFSWKSSKCRYENLYNYLKGWPV